MALFKKKTNVEDAKDVAMKTETKMTSSTVQMAADFSQVLLRPRITEKATMHGQANVHTFDVSPSANKQQIARAVQTLYKVTPKMVRIVTIPSKRKRSARTGRLGVKSGGKKAYVYLKKGDTITINQAV